MSTDLDDDGLEYCAADLRPGRGTYPEGSRIATSDDADDPVHGAPTLMHSSDVNKSTAPRRDSDAARIAATCPHITYRDTSKVRRFIE